MKKAWIKIQNFNHNKNKLRYAYLLTLTGVFEKSKLIAEFLSRKMAEQKKLQLEIETLNAEIGIFKFEAQNQEDRIY